MPAFYNSIDYLLVTGKIEGGPMPVKEAIARGVPVIAPDVGWSWDHPVLEYSTPEQLLWMLKRLAPYSLEDAWAGFAHRISEACKPPTMRENG